ncbi:MAG: CxxC-x17-CxxC domain-containing protein [Patescibacteria group bacterium]|jgi:CxxC-x17-CxxC domain-containing protein
MFNSNRGGGFGGRQGGGGGSRGPWDRGSGGRDGGRPAMFRATCSECGNSCEVPFKPNGSKPVFCNDCFRRDENPSPRRFEGAGERRPSFNSDAPKQSYGGGSNSQDSKEILYLKEQIKVANTKLDNILKALSTVLPTDVSKDEKEIDGMEIIEEIVEKKSADKKKKAVKKAKAKV